MAKKTSAKKVASGKLAKITKGPSQKRVKKLTTIKYLR